MTHVSAEGVAVFGRVAKHNEDVLKAYVVTPSSLTESDWTPRGHVKVLGQSLPLHTSRCRLAASRTHRMDSSSAPFSQRGQRYQMVFSRTP